MMSWIDEQQCENHARAHWLSPWVLIATRPTLPASPFWRRGHPEKADIFQQVRRIAAAPFGRYSYRWFRKDPPLRSTHRNSACTLQESLVDSCAAAWTNKRANPNVIRTGRWWRGRPSRTSTTMIGEIISKVKSQSTQRLLYSG
jgi:hypothetical protein